MTRTLERLARVSLLAGAASLFLAAAATVDVGFTGQPSHFLFGCAVLLGAPAILRAIPMIPLPLQLATLLLVAAYVTALVLGDPETIAGSERAGSSRAFVVLLELLFGLAVMFLIVGLYRGPRELGPLINALYVGVLLASLYAFYQWPAQRYGWPAADVVNVADSNGLTSGGFQGAGILGWERTRGTFLEPHFLAAYLVSLLPLVAVGVKSAAGRASRLLALLALIAGVPALLFTSSFPLWAILLLAIVAGLTLESVLRGRRALSVALASSLAVLVAFAPLAVVAPDALSRLTGRSQGEIIETTRFRTDSWSRAAAIWSAQPVLGYGPGQSSVKLALESPSQADGVDEPPLQSAQGLWAAALVDVGIIGLAAWIAFFGLILAGLAVGASRSELALRVGIWTSTVAALLAAQIAGDRLELTVWVLLGLALAATRDQHSTDRDDSHE